MRTKEVRIVCFKLPIEYYNKLDRFENKSVFIRDVVMKALDEHDKEKNWNF